MTTLFTNTPKSFQLPPPIININLEKQLYKDKPKETVFVICPRPDNLYNDNLDKRLKVIKKYIENLKKINNQLSNY
jgi:hypothetical protein